MKYHIYILLSILLVFTTGCNNQNKEYRNIPPKLFIIGQTELDYGNVEDNEYAVFEHTFNVVNLGGGKLEIKDVHADCGCFKFEFERKALKHGYSLPIKMIMDKRGNRHVESNYTIQILSNAESGNNQIKVHVNMVD